MYLSKYRNITSINFYEESKLLLFIGAKKKNKIGWNQIKNCVLQNNVNKKKTQDDKTQINQQNQIEGGQNPNLKS